MSRSDHSATNFHTVNCQSAVPLLEAFNDGELSPEQTLEVETHLDGCTECTEHCRFIQCMSQSITDVVCSDSALSPEFLARLDQAVGAEITREQSNQAYANGFRWPTRAATFAAAATVTLWFGLRPSIPDSGILGILGTPANDGSNAPSSKAKQAQAIGGVDDDVLTFEGALDRLIDYHSSPPKPQVTQPELLPALEANVGVRIQLPHLEQYGARWEGASLVPVRNQQAASFRYQLPNHRVTIYVFNSSKLRVREALSRQTDLDNPIYVGQWRGYTVAAKENRGIGYAIAADMDDAAITEMMTAIH